MKPREIEWEGMDTINMARDVGKFQAFVKTVKKIRIS